MTIEKTGAPNEVQILYNFYTRSYMIANHFKNHRVEWEKLPTFPISTLSLHCELLELSFHDQFLVLLAIVLIRKHSADEAA